MSEFDEIKSRFDAALNGGGQSAKPQNFYDTHSDSARGQTSVSTEPREEGGEFGKGFKRAFAEVPGMLAGVAAFGADAAGANEVRDLLIDYAKTRGEQVQKDYTSEGTSFSDVLDGKGNVTSFLKDATGYALGQAVMTFATGGAGYLGAKALVKTGAVAAAEKLAAKEIAAGATKEAAAKTAADFLAAEAAKVGIKGATAAGGAQNFGMELGSIYPDAVEQATKEGRTLDAGDKWRVLGAAGAAAATDTAMDRLALGKVLGGSTGATIAKRAAKEIPVGMAREGVTEGIQTGIERYGAGQDLSSPEALRDYIDSAAMGAVGGGAFGAMASVRKAAEQPNSPLSKAAVSGNAEAIAQAAQQAAATPDPFSERIGNIQAVLQQGGMESVRGLGSQTSDEFLYALNIARNPNARPDMREQALSDMERVLEFSKTGYTTPQQERPQALPTQQPGTALAPIGGTELTTPGMPQAFDPNTVEGDVTRIDNMLPGPRALPAPTAALENGVQPAELSPEDQQNVAPPTAEQAAVAETPVAETGPAPFADVAAPNVATPAGDGPAVRRKRIAVLKQLAGNGFETVEKAEDGFYMVNSKTRQRFKLDNAADAQMARNQIKARVDAVAHEAPSSPLNDKTETLAQIEADRRHKPRIELNGMVVQVENPKGAVRKGVSPDGKAWETTMQHHYGEFEGTEGADGDKLDVFVGPRPDSQKVFVVDQIDPKTGKFDEHKTMMGFTSIEDAKAGYLANYEKGWGGLGAITEMPLAEFKKWAKSPEAKKPLALKPKKAAPKADNAQASFPSYHDAAQYIRPQKRNGASVVAAPYPNGDGTYRLAMQGTAEYTAAIANFFVVQNDGKLVQLKKVSKDELPEKSSPVREGEPRQLTKSDVDLLIKVAAALGKQIQVFSEQGQSIADGFFDPKSPDVLNINEVTTINPLAVFGHELIHKLRQENPEAYKAIEAVLKARVSDPKGFRKNYFGDDQGKGDTALSEEVGGELEELASDLGGNLMMDAQFWRDVFAKIEQASPKQAKSIIAKLAAFMQDMIAKLMAQVNQKGFAANDFVTDLNAIQAAYKHALAKYAVDSGVGKISLQADILREVQKVKVAKPVKAEKTAKTKEQEQKAPETDAGEKMRRATLFNNTKKRLIAAYHGESGEDVGALIAELEEKAKDDSSQYAGLVKAVLENFKDAVANYEQSKTQRAAKAEKAAETDKRDIAKSSKRQNAATLEDEGRLVYHVSPLPEFDGTRETSIRAAQDLWNKLDDKLNETEDQQEYSDIKQQMRKLDQLERSLKNGGRAFGDNGQIEADSFYGTTQPEYWRDTQVDELGLSYDNGGIYAVVLKEPVEENMVRSGMGDQAPEAEVKNENVDQILGPFQTKEEARSAVDGIRKSTKRQSAADTLSNAMQGVSGLSALSLEDYTDNEVEIANIEAIEKGAGAGTAAMKKLTDAADENQINLMLIPAGSGERLARLTDFYSRFGFEEDGDVMRRPYRRIMKSTKRLPATIEVDGKDRPTTNSKGQQIHPTEEGVRNFWKWFGDSKFVDDQGRPKVMYHGTKSDFYEFDMNKIGLNGLALGPGFYFAESEKVAGGYGDKVLQVYLRSENPTLNPDKRTITKAQAIKIIEDMEKEDEYFLSNYGDIDYEGRSAVLKAALDDVYFTAKSDADLIGAIINVGGVERDSVMRSVIARTKKDGLIADASVASFAGADGEKIYVVLTPTQIKSATDNEGAFNPKDADIRKSMAGRGAKTADTHALATAEERLNAGDDAEQVRQDTGWFKGNDGKMRFEIDDSDAKFVDAPKLKAWLLGEKPGRKGLNAADARELKKLKTQSKGLHDQLLDIAVADGESDKFGALFDKYASVNNLVKQLEGRSEGKFERLGDVLDHPALFAAYPEIASYTVTLRVDPALKQLADGFFNQDQQHIHLETQDFDEMLNSLLHEVQHGIQSAEGFAGGGSVKTNDASLPAEVVSQIKRLNEEADGASRKAEFAEARRLRAESDNLRATAGFEQYRKLAGEVESRNVEQRRKMTAAERRATPPSATADVADQDVILVFNGKEMHHAPAVANAPMPSEDTIMVDGVERSRLNSKGQPIHGTEDGIRKFWKWFKHSAVVDGNGRPVVGYHVTNADFSEFDLSKTKRAAFGAGFYFATNTNTKKMQGIVEGSTVMPVYLSIKRPASLADVRDAMEEIGYGNYRYDQDVERGMAITANLKSKGFDGADIDGDWLAFDPTQIKSATGNLGEYDGTSPDIRKSAKRAQRTPLQSAIAQVPDRLETMAAPQWKLWLDANAPKLGSSKAEVEASGIKDFLKESGKAKLTKAELIAKLEPKEVTYNDRMEALKNLIQCLKK